MWQTVAKREAEMRSALPGGLESPGTASFQVTLSGVRLQVSRSLLPSLPVRLAMTATSSSGSTGFEMYI